MRTHKWECVHNPYRLDAPSILLSLSSGKDANYFEMTKFDAEKWYQLNGVPSGFNLEELRNLF